MTKDADDRLALLRRNYPEWQSWLLVIESALREAADGKWQAYVPQRAPSPDSKQPFLSGATIDIESAEVSRWLERLLCQASAGGYAATAPLSAAGKKSLPVEPLAVLQASLRQDNNVLSAMADTLGAGAQPFRAVADLAALPLLQACRRRWSALVPESWAQGYCPICGAWPALAEEQGIERTRRLRCGRCGSAWHAECLHCPFCDATEHRQHTSLVQGAASEARRIDGCQRCRGYVKTLMVLQGSAPEVVLLDDLASVDLDIAALDAGYRRPANPGCDPGVRVCAHSARFNSRNP